MAYLSGAIYFMGVLLSCEMPVKPYFTYVSVEVQNGIDANESIFLKYTIKNNGNVGISEIEIYCNLIDDQEKTYEFSYVDEVSIAPDTVGIVTVDISKHFYYMPSSISIKKFYIKKILYDDGAVWKDPNGIFVYPY